MGYWYRCRHVRDPCRSAAFTLIEVLVVLAIIGVLAALLFPVFAAARGKARQATCTSNIRQVAIALFMYVDDWDGMLPPATTKVPGGYFSTEWQGQLDIVWWDLVLVCLRNERVLYCPCAPPYLPSYHANGSVMPMGGGPLDVCAEPSRTLLVFDGWVPNEPNEFVYIPTIGDAHFPGLDEFLRHHDKCQVCFADGHAKLLTKARLSAPEVWSIE
jgi:prepilin-type N-terminal cleavage/methylation domain-containing protein/prepilin-type processing-associated H-X9-DG protein